MNTFSKPSNMLLPMKRQYDTLPLIVTTEIRKFRLRILCQTYILAVVQALTGNSFYLDLFHQRHPHFSLIVGNERFYAISNNDVVAWKQAFSSKESA